VERREHFRPQGQEGLRPGSRSEGGGGEGLGGAKSQEGKVRPSAFGQGASFPSPVGDNLWSRGRAGLRAGAEKRQERRGPERGAAGRGEQGPEGRIPWALRRSTDRRQVRGGASRRGGDQTSRTEGAGASEAPGATGSPGLERAVGNETPGEPASRPAWAGRGSFGTRHSRDEPSAGPAFSRALARGRSRAGKTPGRSKPRRGSGEPNSRYRRGERGRSAGQRQRSADGARQRAFIHVPWARKALEGRGRATAPTPTFQDSPHCPTRSWRASSDTAASTFV